MAAFPSLKNPSPKYFSQTPYRAQVKTRFESGAVQSRPLHTSTRMIFTTGWDGLVESDLQSLYTHFDENVGSTFNFTHPLTSTVYVVRYADNQLPKAKYAGQIDGADAWDIGPINLEEA